MSRLCRWGREGPLVCGAAGIVLLALHQACWEAMYSNVQACMGCPADGAAACAAAAPCFQVEGASPAKQPAAGKKGKKQQQKKAAAAAPAGEGLEAMQE